MDQRLKHKIRNDKIPRKNTRKKLQTDFQMLRNNIIEHSLYAKHSSKQHKCINTFNTQNNPRIEV